MQPRNSNTATRNTITYSGTLSAHIPRQMLDHARQIGLSLLRSFAERPSYVLGITSTLPSEGKTSVSFGLAEVMSTDFGVETLLLDVHAERPWPSLDEEFVGCAGLGNWLAEECTLPDALIHVHEKCSMLPLGTQALSSRDLLQYMVKKEAIKQLRECSELAILDLPDLTNPSGAALTNLCDGVVLVVHAGMTPLDNIKEYLPVLQNIVLHGVIMNRHRSAIPTAIRRLFS